MANFDQPDATKCVPLQIHLYGKRKRAKLGAAIIPMVRHMCPNDGLSVPLTVLLCLCYSKYGNADVAQLLFQMKKFLSPG